MYGCSVTYPRRVKNHQITHTAGICSLVGRWQMWRAGHRPPADEIRPDVGRRPPSPCLPARRVPGPWAGRSSMPRQGRSRAGTVLRSGLVSSLVTDTEVAAAVLD